MNYKKKIKIITVYNSLNFGGTEKYITDLYNSLDENKFDFSICCLLERGKNTRYFEEKNVKIIELKAVNNPSIKYLFQNFVQVIRLYNLLKKGKYDIVHSHDFFPATITRIAAIFAKTPFIIITYHNLFIWLKPFHHRVNKFLAKRTNKIIAVSESVKEFSIKNDRIPEDKYEVIYNGVDFDLFSQNENDKNPYLMEFNIKPNTFVIGTIGSLSFRKGQKYLVKAFSELSKKYDNLLLIMVGGVDNEPNIKRELEDMVRTNNLVNKIIFAGSRHDANKIIHIFNLFVSPSVVEGFGYSVVEAMAAKIPILVSDIPTYKELTKNGKYGLLFQNKNSKDLENKIDFAISNKSKLATEVGEIYNYAKENFDLRKTMQTQSIFFESLIQKHMLE